MVAGRSTLSFSVVNKPTRRAATPCCARAVRGRVTAAMPRPERIFRRLTIVNPPNSRVYLNNEASLQDNKRLMTYQLLPDLRMRARESRCFLHRLTNNDSLLAWAAD